MNRAVLEKSIRHHLDKIQLLERSKEMKAATGHKKLWEQEHQLKKELDSIQKQIDDRHRSIDGLQRQLTQS